MGRDQSGLAQTDYSRTLSEISRAGRCDPGDPAALDGEALVHYFVQRQEHIRHIALASWPLLLTELMLRLLSSEYEEALPEHLGLQA